MPNIEIKAKCDDLSKAKSVAQKLQTGYVGILHQIDTYFGTKTGRLKLREINGERAELIPYSKEYGMGPMKSEYAILPVEKPILTKELLNKLLGTEFVVDKKREVFLIDNVRVHLDQVAGLGSFIEFEAVYDGSNREAEDLKVKSLMSEFGIKSEDLLDKSYVDYLSLNA